MRSLKQLVAGEHAARVRREQLHEVELHRGQRHLAAVERVELALVQVEDAAPEPNLAARGRRRRRAPVRPHPAQHAADAGQELARVERLGEVVVGPDLEPDHPVDRLAGRGQHHDADATLRPQGAGESEPVLAGHAEVEDHEVDRPLRHHLAHRGTTVRDADREALPRQELAQHLPDLGLVVDHQDVRLTRHRLPPPDPRLPSAGRAGKLRQFGERRRNN